jgi:hypothetical protein
MPYAAFARLAERGVELRWSMVSEAAAALMESAMVRREF